MMFDPQGLEELDDLYHEIILDHYKRPRHHSLLEHPNLKAEGFNPFCGDQLVLTAAVDASGRITNVGFSGQGCAISQASTSMMTELLEGRNLEEVQSLIGAFRNLMRGQGLGDACREELGDLVALDGVRKFPIRIKCALLPWMALQDGIEEYQKKA